MDSIWDDEDELEFFVGDANAGALAASVEGARQALARGDMLSLRAWLDSAAMSRNPEDVQADWDLAREGRHPFLRVRA